MLKRLTLDSKNKNRSLHQNKPKIYVKVEREIIKEKIVSLFKAKTDYLLIKKYFNRIKLFHNLIKLKKKIRRNYKNKYFKLFKLACWKSVNRDNLILQTFDKSLKMKIFSCFYKNTQLIKYKNNFKKELYINSMNRFINVIKNSICVKQAIEIKKILFFYKIISLKFQERIRIKLQNKPI